jgi:hypothetical protein
MSLSAQASLVLLGSAESEGTFNAEEVHMVRKKSSSSASSRKFRGAKRSGRRPRTAPVVPRPLPSKVERPSSRASTKVISSERLHLPQRSKAADGRESVTAGIRIGAEKDADGKPTGPMPIHVSLTSNADDDRKHAEYLISRFADRAPFTISATDAFTMLSRAGSFQGIETAFDVQPKPGASVGNRLVPNLAGTLGCKVRLVDGTVAVLTNAHVLDSGHEFGRVDLTAVQPGMLDNAGGFPVGAVLDVQYPDVNNPLDVAIAECSQRPEVQGLFNGRPLLSEPFSGPLVGREVVKIGRTTGLTRGRILRANDIIQVEYEGFGKPVIPHQILIQGPQGGAQAFSEPGDSGAMVYEPVSMMPVGLLYADNRGLGAQGHISVCCPWAIVKLRMRIDEVIV